MESLQLKDNELEQLINAINGTLVPTGEVNNNVEKIKRSDDSTIAFNALNAGMNVKKVGCPIFFVPTDHGSNALANIVEPFKKVAIPTAQEMYTIIKNDTAVYNYCHILAGQTIALMDSNIDIIFQDGFLKVLRTFSKDPNTLICLYNDGKANLGIEVATGRQESIITRILTFGLVAIDGSLHDPHLSIFLLFTSGLKANRNIEDGHLLPVRGVTETGKQLQCLVPHHDMLGKAMHTEKIIVTVRTLLIGESLHAIL
jgi:hypothetical protein